MAQTNAERQRAYRERHRGEPRGNAALQAQLAVLQGRVAQLEAELAGRPVAGRRRGGCWRRIWRCGGSATSWLSGWHRSRRISRGSRTRCRLGWSRSTGRPGTADEACLPALPGRSLRFGPHVAEVEQRTGRLVSLKVEARSEEPRFQDTEKMVGVVVWPTTADCYKSGSLNYIVSN
jgi:hypothetical protein